MLPKHCVFTPHPGEASRLLSCSSTHVQLDRYAAAASLKHKFDAYIALKGAGTIVTQRNDLSDDFSKGELSVCPYGNPAMAVAGTGDVLTGVIAALLAQKLSMKHAIELGVCAHSYAADHVCDQQGEIGLCASELISPIRDVLNNKILVS